ncbi:hypothetical protein HMI54_001249 [Coelomomyces lativittatus]|nr:hypothetical protein HMI56_004424 [Coelomomyces lativittatus]KAJ1517488.1 hypothetical protein HMI55_006947 [Coelomomyces lativittatus]KAJ1518336.1 hypothetical protein HMI54_001249 [Coelomomyces lativittatus]
MDATYPFCYRRHMRLPSPIELTPPSSEPSVSSISAFMPIFDAYATETPKVKKNPLQGKGKGKEKEKGKGKGNRKKGLLHKPTLSKTPPPKVAWSCSDGVDLQEKVQKKRHLSIPQEAMALYDSIVPMYLQVGFQFVCLEIETFEFDPTKITEIGLMVGQRLNESKFKFVGYHFLIQEHIHLGQTNPPPFPHQPHSKFRFIGNSETVPLEEALHDVHHCLTYADLLVSHNIESLLQSLKLSHQSSLVEYCSDPEFPKADTQTLFKAVTKTQECVPIATMLHRLNLPYEPTNLNNAGNDAIYIVAAFLRMMPVMGVNNTSSTSA